MTHWKIKLTATNDSWDLRQCVIADSMDEAIEVVRVGNGVKLPHTAAAQALSEREMENPLIAERIFLRDGDFNAYLREMA